MVVLGLTSAIVMMYLYKIMNKKRLAQTANGVSLSTEELADMGDRAPTYQYVL